MVTSELHPSMKHALDDGAHVRAMRDSFNYTHEVALTLYGDVDNPETAMLSVGRPQGFAAFAHWQYFEMLLYHHVTGREFAQLYWVHLYIDVPTTLPEAVELVQQTLAGMGGLPISLGEEPAHLAPSDPVDEDEFWDPEVIGRNLVYFDEDEPTHWVNQQKSEWLVVPDSDAAQHGPCCGCGKIGADVRNALMLPKLAPIPGKGWGCFECDLPMDGAMQVTCDTCLDHRDAAPEWICYGYVSEGIRVRAHLLETEFDHNRARHEPLN